MKVEIIGLLAGIFLIGCSSDTVEDEIKKDCGCDRVVSVSSFNMPDRTTTGTYVTINDCTEVQRNGTWTGEHNKPAKGSCK